MNKPRSKSAASPTRSGRGVPSGIRRSTKSAGASRGATTLGSPSRSMSSDRRGSTSTRGYDHQFDQGDQEDSRSQGSRSYSNVGQSQDRDYSDRDGRYTQYGEGREGSRFAQTDWDQSGEMNNQQGRNSRSEPSSRRNEFDLQDDDRGYSARRSQGQHVDEERGENYGFGARNRQFEDESSEFQNDQDGQQWQPRQDRGQQQDRGISQGGRQARSQGTRSYSR